ncbi:MAG TPA: DUF692 domain-containing protein [Ideonella sp.]|uniref:DUF692 domain-containing protein n=1 Tax=Ideonella sp. TaxID=1929293 RepID=UPI002CB60F4D|nr:DUF692 domain-containing protein [Ideonella sp.]HSI51500.1 DUF692 domain-containing protein [Ideonella sp.]
MPPPLSSLPCASVGIGWRQSHERELLEGGAPQLGFIEVHSENFFAAGGAALTTLSRARESHAVSLHGVGLALGSSVGLDPWHLDRLAALVERIEPVLVSDHACFARAMLPGGEVVLHGSDLLPLAFNRASLALMARHVTQVQERLRRPLLVENLSAYLRAVPGQAADEMAEPEFFNTLSQQTGCGLLLDVNNLVVNALNEGVADPVAASCGWIDALDPAIVGEVHLAGYNDSGALVIDDHGSTVREPVWQVYRHALARLGARPTLVEWDTDIPAWPVLLGEAERARAEMQKAAA